MFAIALNIMREYYKNTTTGTITTGINTHFVCFTECLILTLKFYVLVNALCSVILSLLNVIYGEYSTPNVINLMR